MPSRLDSAAVAEAVEFGLWAVGLVLLWRLVLRPKARAARGTALTAWDTPPSGILLLLGLVLLGAIVGQVVSVAVLKHTRYAPETQLILINTAVQCGMLGSLALFFRGIERQGPALAPDPGAALSSGAATFLIVMPVVGLVTLAWQSLLTWFGVPVEAQDVVELFLNVRSPGLRLLIVILAVVIAPMTEELVFRAGMFRYLRTRAPRWVALFVPALIFGLLHVTWGSLAGLGALLPMFALAVVFSLAYERTGRIGTVMVAHALFNLNTVVLVLAGVNF